MSDFEKFAEYWEQAVNGLVYRVKSNSGPLVTRTQVQALWQEELLSKRFLSSGLKHGARVFMDELAERDPQAAAAVQQALKSSVMPVGAEAGSIAGDACLTAAGAAVANTEKIPTPVKALALTVSALFAAKAARDTMQGGKGLLTTQIEAEAARQLQTYRALLDK